eukprot:NODE_19_length_3613_cov_52.142256_g17_i0.p1 GENE.NODE_19_length_3613_cov_52.142256_g17_i0~~NODE_19_length_3613_cov_52.142256_g17_i0.p1  ORF type:complete len:514 (-),score=123.13 NODE_19_length_3613_cov_52.142256_g17_i0:2072-3502(-)
MSMPHFSLFAGIVFGWLSVFAMHFILMLSMKINMDWKIDIFMTIASLVMITFPGAGGIALAVHTRCQFEQANEFLMELELQNIEGNTLTRSLRKNWIQLVYVLPRVSRTRLVACVLLLSTGAASCHHLGMLSVRGGIRAVYDPLQMLPTLVLGVVVCTVAVLVFVVCPTGSVRFVISFVLSGAVMLFHSISNMAMDYYQDTDLGVGPSFEQSTILVMLFIGLQCIVNFAVVDVFAKTVATQHTEIVSHVTLIQRLAQCISCMNLEEAKTLQSDQPSPTEKALFTIVQRLEEFQPYLPDTLFFNTTLSPRTSVSSSEGPPRPSQIFSSGISSSTSASTSQAAQIDTGLMARPVSLLVAQISGLPMLFKRACLNDVETYITTFVRAVESSVKEKGGMVVQVVGGRLLAIWQGQSPNNACNAALHLSALLAKTGMHVRQAIASGLCLVGNAGGSLLRSYAPPSYETGLVGLVVHVQVRT